MVLAALARHRERFNAVDRDGWLSNLVDHPYLEEPVGTGLRHGREHYGAVFDAFHTGGPRPGIPPYDGVVVCGNEVAVYLRATPRAADREPEPVIEIFEIAADGRIAGIRAFVPANRLPPAHS